MTRFVEVTATGLALFVAAPALAGGVSKVMAGPVLAVVQPTKSAGRGAWAGVSPGQACSNYASFAKFSFHAFSSQPSEGNLPEVSGNGSMAGVEMDLDSTIVATGWSVAQGYYDGPRKLIDCRYTTMHTGALLVRLGYLVTSNTLI